MVSMAMSAPGLGDLGWTVVNDTVMGGRSSSSVQVEQTLRFEGTLSLEQNGGFTSIRSARPVPLAGATALRIELRGDGRTYELTLRRSDVPLRAGSYRVEVPTTDAFTVIEVPLSAFRPTSFGRPVVGVPTLDAAPERIDSVGFLLADGNPGPFWLEVRSLAAVEGATARPPSHGALLDELRAAIARGVPAFNAGNVGRCRELYAAALQRAHAHPALTAGERAIVGEALQAAQPQAPTEAAWTLRHALDTLLRG